jgi:putative membrane protein
MAEINNLLIVCVDRDNDIGKKAKTNGPITGRKANLNVAAKLAVADPSESDVNCIFGAIKKFDELNGKYNNVEVVTFTGAGKLGFEADKKINDQLDRVLENFPADAFVLVTDGAEDDQVLPILQSRAKVISKETIVVKQASEVESTYYTIKEALKDPSIARIVFLIPGIVIILWGLLFLFNIERFFWQGMAFIVGFYLILRGLGIEDRIVNTITETVKAISLQRVSFPFYLMSIFLLLIGGYAVYSIINNITYPSLFEQYIDASNQAINFLTLTAIAFIIAKCIDLIQLKKAFYLRKYFLSGAAILVLWFIADSGIKVFSGESYAGLEWFLTNVFIAFLFGLGAYRLSGVLEVRKKITKLLIGFPVYDQNGKWIGKVEEIEKEKRKIKYLDIHSKKTLELARKNFRISDGKIMITV